MIINEKKIVTKGEWDILRYNLEPNPHKNKYRAKHNKCKDGYLSVTLGCTNCFKLIPNETYNILKFYRELNNL